MQCTKLDWHRSLQRLCTLPSRSDPVAVVKRNELFGLYLGIQLRPSGFDPGNHQRLTYTLEYRARIFQ